MEVAELLAQAYPFGREHEASVQLLFRFFCNNILLGQYELARMCIPELHSEQNALKEPVIGLLHRIASQGIELGCGLCAISWPCFLEYEKLENTATLTNQLRNNLEFSLCAHGLCGSLSSEILFELYQIYKKSKADIGAELLSFLSKTLAMKPREAFLLIEYLRSKATEEQICAMITSTVDQLLSQMSHCSTSDKEEKSKIIYQVLSRCEEAPGSSFLTHSLRPALERIVSSWSGGLQSAECLLDRASVYSALLGKRSLHAVNVLCNVEANTRFADPDLEQFYRWRGEALNTIQHQQHFMDRLLEDLRVLPAADLVNRFNVPEYQPLLGLIFQLAWQMCGSPEQTHRLIQAFSKVKDTRLSSLLEQYRRVDLIEQSLQLARCQTSKRADLSVAMVTAVQSQSLLQALLTLMDDLENWNHQRMIQTLSAKNAYALLSNSLPVESAGSIDTLTPDQCRDISLFNAFYVVNLVMEAIQASAQLTVATPKGCSKCDGSSSRHFQHKYSEGVVKRLTQAKNLLKELRPLTLRLQVMEDMYTLLFAVNSDIKESSMRQREGSFRQASSPIASDEEIWFSAREAVTPQKSARSEKRIHTGKQKDGPILLSSESSRDDNSSFAVDSPLCGAYTGFLANEFIVRDVHLLLKEALTDLSVQRFQISADKGLLESEMRLGEMTLTKIKEASFVSKWTQLQQRVSEGIWRFQLLMQDSIPKEFGATSGPIPDNVLLNDDEGYSRFERSLDLSRSSALEGNLLGEHSGRDSENSYSDTGANSSENASASRPKMRRYKRRREVSSMVCNSQAIPLASDIVRRMLSPPDSLLNTCLRRVNSKQSREVLKVFNLENSEPGLEVQFSESYMALVNQLCSASSNETAPPIQGVGSFDLSIIRQAAESGLNVLSDSSKVEKLVELARLPSSLLQIEDQPRQQLLSIFPADMAPVMVLLDLSCVATTDAKLSQQNIQLALRKLPENTATFKDSLKGVTSFLHKAAAIANLAASSDPSLLSSFMLSGSDNLSLKSVLLSATLPLDAAAIRNQLQSYLELCEGVSKVERSLTAWRKHKQEQQVTALPIKKLLQTLSRLFADGDKVGYLNELNEQIKLLHRLITDNTAKTTSHFAVLHDGPTIIMGRLMFQHKVPPAKLASVAERVKLDLTHVIVRSCCPPQPCKPLVAASRKVNQHMSRTLHTSYRMLLNGEHEEPMSFELDPINIVTSLLDNLLSLMKGFVSGEGFFGKTAAKSAYRSSGFNRFVLDCSQLKEVNLDLLLSDDEKRAFFINTHNLLSLHAMIVWFGDHLNQCLPAVLSHLHLQLGASYIVGQLGPCSLFELQQFLLKVNNISQLDLSMEHPWFQYAPEANPATTFLLFDGSLNFQAVSPVNAANLATSISEAQYNYMQRAVIFNCEERKIYLPDMLVRGKSQFLNGQEGEVVTGHEHSALLKWICSFQHERKVGSMRLLVDGLDNQHEEIGQDVYRNAGSVEVIVTPQNHQLGYCMEYNPDTVIGLSVGADSGEDELPSPARLTRSDSILHRANFKISDVAIQYLHEKAPVVAMLLDIIYEEFLLSDQKEGQAHFCSQTLESEYPPLAKYLKQYIAPLCAHLAPDVIHLEYECLSKLAEVDLTPCIRSSILAHKQAPALLRAAGECIDALWKAERFDHIVKVIDHIIGLTFDPNPCFLAVRDYALIQCASERVSTESIACIRQLQCDRLQAHIVISCLHKSRWTVDKCLQILPLCERRLAEHGDQFLVTHLCRIKERMSAFHTIMQHAQNKQAVNVEGCNEKVLNHLVAGWWNVAELLAIRPRIVFNLLLEAKEFSLAKSLADTQKDLDDEIKMLVFSNFIVDALNKNSKDSGVVKILEQALTDSVEWCYRLCTRALQGVHSEAGLIILCRFMVSELSGQLSPQQQQEVQLYHIGCQSLMCLDEGARGNYRHLIGEPHILLEQLLMNSKITWAEKVVSLIRVEDMETGPCTQENINKLLYSYAEKAVDFPVINSSADSKPSSQDQVNTGSSGSKGPPPLMRTLTLAKMSVGSSPPISGSPSPIEHRHSPGALSSSLGRTFIMPPKAISSPNLLRHTNSSSNLSSVAGEFGRAGIEVANRSGEVYLTQSRESPARVIPEEILPEKDWVPDEKAAACMVCHIETFSMFTRRHHCRCCGRVVCAACSSQTAPVKGRNVRVCDECYSLMATSKTNSLDQGSITKRLKDKLSGAALTGLSSSQTHSGFEASNRYIHPTQEMVLTCDLLQNADIRNEFFYEHAPSVTLCTSILKLNNDNVTSGRFMLRLCEKLSNIIKPVRTGSVNQEVDYNLVISMMKFLLFNAKLLFVSENFADGVSLCEAYSNRVEVLSLLLSAYYLDLPTVYELSNIDYIRRLRDRLMEDERPVLAMEISTKFGLDTAGLWTAWGLACLKSGDYKSARDKFSKVLKPPIDRNSQQVAHSKILNDIVMAIESQAANINSLNPNSIKSTLQALCLNKDLIKTIPCRSSDACQLDENQMHVQECLFYLKTYGNHGMLLEFYRSHDFWQSGVQYILDKKCLADTFIEYLLIPALKLGELSTLQDQMLLIDPTLIKWNSYLTAACVYLSRSKHFHSLYQIQLFQKDYIRAAMTCIQRFYLFGAKRYSELFSRLPYLQKALENFQAYLIPSLWEKIPRPNLSAANRIETSARLTQSESEVKSHINTVKLQIEVTKFLNQFEGPNSMVLEDVLTLFGDITARSKLAAQIILYGKSVSEGFELAFRLIQEYQLKYDIVYSSVSENLGRRGLFTQLHLLISCIRESGFCDDDLHDGVILTAIRTIDASNASQSKDLDNLIKLLRKASSKIESQIACGKLRNAYLLAINMDSREEVERIAKEAERLNQPAVKLICDKYLKQKGHKT